MSTQRFTTTDGITGRLKNPHEKNITLTMPFGDVTNDGNPDYYNFEASAVSYPIHSDKPIEGEFEGELVWQIETTKKWSTITASEYETYKNSNAVLRQAVQPVPVKGEEKVKCPTCKEYADSKKPSAMVCSSAIHLPFFKQGVVFGEQTKLSVEQYHVCHECQLSELRHCNEADKCGNDKSYPKQLRDNTIKWHESKLPLSIVAEKSFDMGHTHALASSNLVELEEVVAVLENIKEMWRISAPINDIVTYELNKAITQIKQLKQVKE